MQDRVFWTNRWSEIKEILQELSVRADKVEEVTHVQSKLNPADIGIPGEAKMGTVGCGSPWQTVPEFLTTCREDWPVRLPGKIVED